MKSTIESSEGLNRKIKVEVPQDVVAKTFEAIYKNIQQSVEIKGFRKGKAPIAQIKAMYGPKAREDALDRLVGQSYNEALMEHSLDPISQPHIHIGDFDEKKDFSYTAEVEVRPSVEIKVFEGLEVEKEEMSLPEGKIDEVINNIRSNFQETQPVFEDRLAQEGDVAEIDFDGSVDGAPLPGGQANNHMLELGSNSFIPGFEEGVIGMKAGVETTIDLKFPEDYHASEIAGKDVSFKVKLHKLHKKVLPELNDEFAQKVADKFKTIDDLKTAIREDLENNEKRRIEEDMRNKVLKQLVAKNPVEIPKSLYEKQLQKMRDDVTQRLKQQGMDENGIKEYHEKWKSDYDDSASFMIQASFLVDALAEKLDFKAEDKDIEDKMVQQSKEMGLPIEQFREYYSKPEMRANLGYQIVEEKVVKHLLDTAKLK